MFLFLSLTVEDFCNGGALDLHCALGTKFLTAKASYAIGAVYDRLFVLYFYCLCRTDIGTYAATDAHLFDKDGLCTQNSACEFGKASLDRILAVACKEH